jgi:hypothetical protein
MERIGYIFCFIYVVGTIIFLVTGDFASVQHIGTIGIVGGILLGLREPDSPNLVGTFEAALAENKAKLDHLAFWHKKIEERNHGFTRFTAAITVIGTLQSSFSGIAVNYFKCGASTC